MYEKEYCAVLKMQLMAAHGLIVLLREDSGTSRALAADSLDESVRSLLPKISTKDMELPLWFCERYGDVRIRMKNREGKL